MKLTEEVDFQKTQLKTNMSLSLPGTSVKMLATLQRNDPAFSKVFDNLKDKKCFQHFFLHDEVLFRKHRLGNGILVDQMAIPESLAPQIIKNFHQQNFYSHLGLAGMKRHLEAEHECQGNCQDDEGSSLGLPHEVGRG